MRLRREGVGAIHGDAANEFVLEKASLATARILPARFGEARCGR